MDTQELNTLIGQKMIEFILDDKMPEDIKLRRLEFLLDKGADVNTKDKDGKTALMWASEYGHKEVAELLVKAEEESKAKPKEELKEDAKSLSNDKDKKNNTKGGFFRRIFGGNDGM